MFVTSPETLKDAINLWKTCPDEEKDEIIEAIGTYKWYNYYQHTHIKMGSESDLENESVFKELETVDPMLHGFVEMVVDRYIDRLNKDADF